MTERADIAIALAWPETSCKQAGAWYDAPLRKLGINRNGFYQVGHAAVILLKRGSSEASYFDMGRYHAPVGTARVRDRSTDHELRIHARVEWTPDSEFPVDLYDLLQEVGSRKACHGDGIMHWAAIPVDHDRAVRKARYMQGKHFIPYGPFIPWGSNCSRFVNTVIRAGLPALHYSFLLRFPWMLSPTPLHNVQAISTYGHRGVVAPDGSTALQPSFCTNG
ncbi:MAG: hypothetical protein K8H89_09750 [Flavobacteriales bacterium]|nr:hypothetical protein [Flavobacteriales bacterium]